MNDNINNISRTNEQPCDEKIKVAEETTRNAELEKVKVHLDIYQRGMENWNNEVQILLCPILENGRNAVALHSGDIEFNFSIFDYDDNEKNITLRVSSMYEGGHRRGLSILRFTPCLGKDDNFWAPNRNARYWISFKAVGTDGKLYISDEAEIVLNACPVIHGKPICSFSAPKTEKTKGGDTDISGMDPSKLAEQARIVLRSTADNISKKLRKEMQSRLEELEGSDEIYEDDLDEINERLEEMISERLEEIYEAAGEIRDQILEAFDNLKDEIDDIKDEIDDMIEEAIENREEDEEDED